MRRHEVAHPSCMSSHSLFRWGPAEAPGTGGQAMPAVTEASL